MRLMTHLLLPALLLLGACNASVNVSDGEATGKSVIEVRDAFIVQPPEGRDITGGGLHVSVQGPPVTLVKAAVEGVGSVEMHTMAMENDMMQMRKVDAFEVTQETPLVLERGGNHLMLFGVSSLQIGDQVDVTLTFTDESGNEQVVVTEAEIVPAAG